MSDLTDDCEHCGAPPSEFAFVKYQIDARAAQERTDWYEDTAKTILAIVCTECGLGKACLDPRENEDLPDFDELPDGTGGQSFKVDRELE